MSEVYHAHYHGGPLAGMFRAFPHNPGERIALPTSNGSEVVYERDESEYASRSSLETGLHVYYCIFNGLVDSENLAIGATSLFLEKLK